MKRSVKEGSKFSFLTKTVSIMSNTGIAKICCLHKSRTCQYSCYIYQFNQRDQISGDLIASNDMDDHKQVSHCDKPDGLLQSHENVVINAVSKDPIAEERYREVANGDYDVSYNNSSPHWNLWGHLRSRWDGCLNLQHDVVTCVGKSHISHRVQEVEYFSRSCRGSIRVVYIWLNPFVHRCSPSDSWVTINASQNHTNQYMITTITF